MVTGLQWDFVNVSQCTERRILHAMKGKILSYGCISLRGV